MGQTSTVDAAPRWRRTTLLGQVAILTALLAAPATAWGQASLAPAGPGDGDPPGLDCLTDAHGTLGASPQVIDAGQTATLHWNVQAPPTCGGLTVSVDTFARSRSGEMAVDGIDAHSVVMDTHLRRSYGLWAVFGSARRQLASVDVDVYLPHDADGRPSVVISANDQVPLFLLGAGTPNARVVIDNGVALDLTGHTPVFVAQGVHLIGGRTTREPGGMLFMHPKPLVCYWDVLGEHCSVPPTEIFLQLRDDGGFGGDDVRITGLRIWGMEMSSVREITPEVYGILVHSRHNVEIDNNEIYGWRGAAVKVADGLEHICIITSAKCPFWNADTVRVHDNYIHHNQHDKRDGYGVSVASGAYALIERNVFDYNRHAVMGTGDDGTGYMAYRNLVLEHGGFGGTYVGVPEYTQQFDMHGQETCNFVGHSCGTAGEMMDIRHNSFFYLSANAFKLRGNPSWGVHVVSNVFAHEVLTSTWQGNTPVVGALGGYVSDMIIEDNQLGINENGHYGHCDFDHDGIDDDFLATGETWWFRSPGHHWHYLNMSRARLDDLSLGDVDGDGRCDVVVGGVVSSGGGGPFVRNRGDIVWQASTGSLTVWGMNGGAVAEETSPGAVPPTWRLAGRGDFSGDGTNDLVWRDDAGQAWLWDMADGWRVSERAMRPFGTLQGTGDFDGDGADDLLWRDATGQLAIGFGAPAGRASALRGPELVPFGYGDQPLPVDPAWVVRGVGDFDGDGRADILFQHEDGQIAIWRMAGARRLDDRIAAALPKAVVQAVADFDNDGRADILWRASASALTIWFSGEAERVATVVPGAGTAAGATWTIADVRDFNGDGRADLLWQETTGRLALWILEAGRFVREEFPRLAPSTWTLANRFAGREGDVTGGGAPPVDCGRWCE